MKDLSDNICSLLTRLAGSASDYEKIMSPAEVNVAILLHAGAAILRDVPEEKLDAALEEACDLLVRGRTFGRKLMQEGLNDEPGAEPGCSGGVSEDRRGDHGFPEYRAGCWL